MSESESMIDRHLNAGILFIGFFNGMPIAVCIAVNLDPYTVEIKNIAVEAAFR